MSDEPIPGSDAPAEAAPPPRWWQNHTLRLGAIVVLGVLVTLIVLAIMSNLGGEPEPSASASASASPSTSASTEPSASASASESSPSEEPSPTPNTRSSIGSGIGVDWETVATFEGAGVGDVTAGGPGWVAVGAAGPVGCEMCGGLEEYSARIWTSRDGRSWNEAAVPDPDGATLHAVAAGPGGLVAVGYRQVNDTVGLQLLTSPDGITWTRIQPPGFAPEGTDIRDLEGGSAFVAVGSIPTADGPGRPAIWRSTKGVDWTEVFRATTDGWVQAITRNGTGYAVVGGEFVPTGDATRPAWPYPFAWTSADGASWVKADLPDGASAIGGGAADVLLTALGLIVVGYGEYPAEVNGFAAWHSPGGSTWHAAPVTADFLEDIGGAFRVYASADRVFALGSSCRCGTGLPGRWWTTVDGLNWVEHRETPPILVSVIPFGDGLLAAAQINGMGAILISE